MTEEEEREAAARLAAVVVALGKAPVLPSLKTEMSLPYHIGRYRPWLLAQVLLGCALALLVASVAS